MTYDDSRPTRAARQRPPIPVLPAAEVCRLLELTPAELRAEANQLPAADPARETYRIDHIVIWASLKKGPDAAVTNQLAERMDDWLRSK